MSLFVFTILTSSTKGSHLQMANLSYWMEFMAFSISFSKSKRLFEHFRQHFGVIVVYLGLIFEA